MMEKQNMDKAAWEAEMARKYVPHFRADKEEPFSIDAVGYTFFYEDGPSRSCRRRFSLPESCSFLIEYAVYFDFDIQHLYDLEHVFVYVGEDGGVLDVEASFHGMFLKSMINGALAFEETHPVMYLQPGKHAVMPDPSYFNLFIGRERVCRELAGNDGFLVAPMFAGRLETCAETDAKVREYIRENYSFTPSFCYEPAKGDAPLLMPWEELDERIVERMKEWLLKIGIR